MCGRRLSDFGRWEAELDRCSFCIEMFAAFKSREWGWIALDGELQLPELELSALEGCFPNSVTQ